MIELVGDELYQWDTGRKVKITPKRGYTISCVHFNDGSEKSLTMVNGVATAMIPDKLLEQCGSVTVYAVHTGEKLIETTESRQFYIKKKTKPTGYTHVQEEVVTINSAITAKNIMVGEHGTPNNPDVDSALFKAKTYAKNASTSATNASTSETNANAYKVAAENAKNEILGNGGTYSDPKDKSALKEIRDSRGAIKTIESNMSTAVEAAGQINSFRSEITTSHDETINARNEILGSGDDTSYIKPANNSALKEIRDAKNIIVGDSETASAKNPDEESALKKAKEAQAAAAQSAKEAKEAAASANQGIEVVNSLEDTSTSNALSANKGRELNEKINNLTYSDISGLENALATKVDKEDGKGLSTNDYTTEEKTKLFNIAENANNYVHPTSHAASMITEDSTHKFITDEEKTKLAGIETNANKTTVVDNLKSDSSTYALSANQGKLLKASIDNITTDIGNLGGGDMMKAMYDMDDNGKVDKADDADKFGGQLPSYYAKAKNVSDLTLDIEQINSDLNLKVNNSAVGQANGVATLDENGKILSTQLPYASANTLGVIKVGNNLSITEDGTLSANAQKIDVDNTLDSNSVNPVQNKVVKNALDGKSDTTHNHDGTYLKPVDVSNSITKNSTSAVSSGAVFSRIGNLKFVVSPTPPTSADNNTFTIVVPN